MKFLDSLKKQEHDKNRRPSWSQAVAELCRFIRHYLREAGAESPLCVKPDMLRVDNVLLDRLTIFLYKQTVTVTPLSMNDSRAPDGGGCVLMQSTNGVTYNLLWDGSTAALRDHWRIVPVEAHGQTNKVQLDRLTVFFNGPLPDELAPLDEGRLDEALLRLFGLTTGTETETPTVREERPIHLSTPVAPLSRHLTQMTSDSN